MNSAIALPDIQTVKQLVKMNEKIMIFDLDLSLLSFYIFSREKISPFFELDRSNYSTVNFSLVSV